MKYYIYQHIRLDRNEIFYIGKGMKYDKGNIYRRAFTKNSRNNYWKNIVQKIPYKVEILEEFENEVDCLSRETELIKLYGFSWNNTGILCNIVENNNEIKKLGRIKATKNNSKKVHQYDLKGNYITSFKSIKEAKLKYPCDIYNATSGRHLTAGGFQWSLNKYKKIKPYVKENNNINRSKTVYQYDQYNRLIKEWKGTKDPSKKLGINRESIRNCLSNIATTAGNYKWSYSKLSENINGKYEVYKDGNLLLSHDKLNKCAEYLGLNPYIISVYLKRGKAYKGYIFKTKNERVTNKDNGTK